MIERIEIVEHFATLLFLESFLRRRPVVIEVEGETSTVRMEGKTLFTFSGELEVCIVSLLRQYGLNNREWQKDDVTPYLLIKGRDIHEREAFGEFREEVLSSDRPLLISLQGKVLHWNDCPLFELSKNPNCADRSTLAHILKGLVGVKDIHHLCARIEIRQPVFN